MDLKLLHNRIIAEEVYNMKYFKELTKDQQEKVLDNIQDLPLFQPFRENARNLLLQSNTYMFDSKLKLHVLSGSETICNGDILC